MVEWANSGVPNSVSVKKLMDKPLQGSVLWGGKRKKRGEVKVPVNRERGSKTRRESCRRKGRWVAPKNPVWHLKKQM